MTHLNVIMKKCDAFSTLTTRPTSRMGVATRTREGSFPDKTSGNQLPEPRKLSAANRGGIVLMRRGRGIIIKSPHGLSVCVSDVSACCGLHCLCDLPRSIDARFLKWAVASESERVWVSLVKSVSGSVEGFPPLSNWHSARTAASGSGSDTVTVLNTGRWADFCFFHRFRQFTATFHFQRWLVKMFKKEKKEEKEWSLHCFWKIYELTKLFLFFLLCIKKQVLYSSNWVCSLKN